MTSKYSDQLMLWLKDEGYTHCLYLAGGGSMHLLDSASKYFECIPFVHEVSAAIATEYFNESEGQGKAFCLVTTGPGLTNTITAIAGAWLESHELLILAGQVKTIDLATGGIRQRGIQELPGTKIAEPISKETFQIRSQISEVSFKRLVKNAKNGRKGPVVIEVCIDISAATKEIPIESVIQIEPIRNENGNFQTTELTNMIRESQRPLVLLGGGVSRAAAKTFVKKVEKTKIPIATTWAGADRVSSEYISFAGRPNTFGMRWANVFQQQADLLIAVGTRLGLQQTGFNWEQFCPVAKVVLVEIDQSEIDKGHPKIDLGIKIDSTKFLEELAPLIESNLQNIGPWLNKLDEIRRNLPILEDCQKVSDQFVNPYELIKSIEANTNQRDIFTPGTSGGTHTAFYQTFYSKDGQRIISNKGLASMGYGLAGAIGAALANPQSRIFNFEGDGSFSQNLQELATVSRNNLNIKMFIINNNGYASIRSSQIAYFGGNYLGCDTKSGLGFPDWGILSRAFSIEYFRITPSTLRSDNFLELINANKPVLFEVMADPEQMYLPKITSVINEDGTMTSNPLHKMSPEIDSEIKNTVFEYLPKALW